MNTVDNLLWQAKLAARLHDPAEKALILMRTREGHEGGTSATLLSELLSKDARKAVKETVRKADHWASAADRAAFPKHEDDGRWPGWQNVRFDEKPVLIHPLTGESFNLKDMKEVDPEHIKAVSLDHFRGLVQADDSRRTLLAFWRFGPELRDSDLGALWQMTPADTRVPDHTIWDHLDLTSALAGAFANGDSPALLAVSLGPVQSFIASARSTSDLWAGSHLLSRLAWEAMRVVCENYGPDAILFPRLRGVPQVDLWLREACGLHADLFERCAWMRKGTDANPLFAAALPNRFTAIVPGSKVREIGEKITRIVQEWALGQTEAAFRLLLTETGIEDDSLLPAYAQIREQLAGFPEVHWASVPWSLVKTDKDGKVDASDPALADAMQPFFGPEQPGFLGMPAWQLMSGGWQLEEGWFWRPNPGALYPALHELLERTLAATKATREFNQIRQEGWRCSLTGEGEWLTTDRTQLALPPGQRTNTLWTRVGEGRKAWVKKGEHLGALATLKRLWPTLFVKEMHDLVGDMQRFVVSTHTMALTGLLAHWLERGETLPTSFTGQLAKVADRVALPPKLARAVRDDGMREQLAKIPAWLESAREADRDGTGKDAEETLKSVFGQKPESYYALILMDGDEMGAWLSAADGKTRPHQDSFHPQVRAGLGNRFSYDKNFLEYAKASRAPNPAWHMVISEALNHFALTLAPTIVHDQFNGRLLYAGGDDLLAMLPVSDLLPAMAALRAAYAGIKPQTVGGLADDVGFGSQSSGFIRHGGLVLRVMGEKATASIGAVIAHHKTPLNLVLRELRVAEQRAKTDGGRDAFSITVLKRSGGAQRLTSKWRRMDGDSPMTCLRELAATLRTDEARRTAYNAQQWMIDLPRPDAVGGSKAWRIMVAQLLAAQFRRQGIDQAEVHAGRLANLPLPDAAGSNDDGRQRVLDHISQFLSIAEFMAREGRA